MSIRDVSPDVSIAGSILVDARCLDEVRANVTSEQFSDDRARAVFDAACALADRGKTIDPVTIKAEAPLLDGDWMIFAMEVTGTAANAALYCKELQKEAMRRDLLRGLNAITSDLLAGHDVMSEAAELQSLAGAMLGADASSGVVSSTTAMRELLDDIDRAEQGYDPFVPTGFRDLDAILGGGLLREGFYVLGARPGCGKTTLGIAIAERMLEAGKRVLFVSLEMSRKQLTARRLAAASGVATASQIIRGDLNDQDYQTVSKCAVELGRRPLSFNRRANLNVPEVQFLARQAKADIVVLDYLGLLQYEPGRSLYERVTATSNRLKRMARALEAPVLCLCQLNRESEARQGQAPRLSDLRDSGAVEQDADGVLLIHKPIEPEDEYAPVPMEVTVAKNRHGKTGKVEFNWYMRNGRILEVRQRGW